MKPLGLHAVCQTISRNGRGRTHPDRGLWTPPVRCHGTVRVPRWCKQSPFRASIEPKEIGRCAADVTRLVRSAKPDPAASFGSRWEDRVPVLHDVGLAD